MISEDPKASIMPVKGRFAIILTWPDIKNAEYEIALRVSAAADELGLSCVVLDNDGYFLFEHGNILRNQNIRASVHDFDFVISLHFESAKIIDCYSYYAIWNPIQFYFTWGYEASIKKIASHNDYLSCDCELADSHMENIVRGIGHPLNHPLPRLHHSLDGELINPQRRNDRVMFYIGINWERTSNEKGRYHDLLSELDTLNLVALYGPREFLGKKVWQGFRNYKGSPEFDGRSTIKYIAEAGCALVLSSEAHQDSGLMSSRLFEAMAAGAVIIANRNKWIHGDLEDCVYVVDDSGSASETAAKYAEVLRHINANPEESYEKAIRAQEIFRERYALGGRLRTLYEKHAERQAYYRSKYYAKEAHVVDVIAIYLGQSSNDLSRMLDSVVSQVDVVPNLHLIIDQTFGSIAERLVAQAREQHGLNVVLHTQLALEPSPDWSSASGQRKRRTGTMFREVMLQTKARYFAFLRADALWFSDHLTTLARALEGTPGAAAACSGRIHELPENDRNRRERQLIQLNFEETESMFLATSHRHGPQFLFSRQSVSFSEYSSVLDLLDGQEHALLMLSAALKGPIANSNHATYVFLEWAEPRQPLPIVPIEEQQQFIRDFFRNDPRWRDIVNGVQQPRRAVYSSWPGVPLRPEWRRNLGTRAPEIKLGEPYYFGKGGNARPIQVAGLSTEEGDRASAMGPRSDLLFRLGDPRLDSLLTLEAEIPSNFDIDFQKCRVYVNGSVIAHLLLLRGRRNYHVLLASDLVEEDGVVRLAIVPSHQVLTKDGTAATLLLYSLSVDRIDADTLETIKDREGWDWIAGAVRSGEVGKKRQLSVEAVRGLAVSRPTWLPNGRRIGVLDLRWGRGRAVLELRPNASARRLLREADKARDDRNWAVAVDHYRAFLDIYSKDFSIWIQYGHVLKETGRISEAELAYREGIRLEPTAADSHLQLAHVLKHQGRLDEAAAAYLKAIVLNPASHYAAHELRELGWSAEELIRLLEQGREEAA